MAKNAASATPAIQAKPKALVSFYTALTLTDDQQGALAALEAFLDNDLEQVFMLMGYAGTGKTTLMKGLADYWAARANPLLLTAPTGRAARVLEERVGRPVTTIHQVLYKPDDIDSGAESADGTDPAKRGVDKADAQKAATPDLFSEPVFVAETRTVTERQLLLVIDEASMVSDLAPPRGELTFGSGQLLRDILEYSKPQSAKDPGVKVLFVGDPAQLPPVMMATSPALDAQYLFEHYSLRAGEYTLRHIMRQSMTSALSEATMTIRTMMESGQFRPPPLDANGKDILRVAEKHFVDVYLTKKGSKVVIVNSNRNALRYNTEIRERIHAALKPAVRADQPVAGDLMMVARNAFQYNLVNGDRLIFQRHGPGHYETHQTVLSEFDPPKEVRLRWREAYFLPESPHATDAAQPNAADPAARPTPTKDGKDAKPGKDAKEAKDASKPRLIRAWYVVESLYDSDKPALTREQDTAVQMDFRQRLEHGHYQPPFDAADNWGNNTAKAPDVAAFGPPASGEHDTDDFDADAEDLDADDADFEMPNRPAISDAYRNALILKYGYAVTCHKAQGGEWDTVFVLWDYRRDDRNSETFLRWAYTALTRARLQVIMAGSLYQRE